MQTEMEIQIDSQFRDLIPPLTPDERTQLEQNLVLHGGARDPIVVWKDENQEAVIVDGHNRYEICTRLDLLFNTHEMRFDDRNAAML
jgi:hypothetical protein